MAFTFTISLKLTEGSLVPVLSSFTDDAEVDPPVQEFDCNLQAAETGTLRWDFHSSATPPAAGSGDIGTGTIANIVGGPQTVTVDLSAYPEETGYLHYRVSNVEGNSNVLTSQIITTPATFAPANLFGASDAGLVVDPAVPSTLYQDTAKTTLADTDGESIALIVDVAGKTSDLTQANASYRPLYKTDGSLHWILPGTNDFFTIPGDFLDETKDWTIVMAVERSGTGSYIFGSNDTAYNFGYYGGTPRFMRIALGPAAAVGGGDAAPIGTPVVYRVTWTRSTGNLRLYINGVLNSQSTASPPSDIAVKTYKLLSNNFDGSTNAATDKHFFSFFIDRALGTSEIANLEQWAADRAGITL